MLDSRRDKAAAAASAAEKAQAGVAELENRLQTNATLTTQQTQALRNAEAEAKRLKRSLKLTAKERSRLAAARKKAAARAAKARQKQQAAEAKYDKVVLADIVRREKERDRAQLSPENDLASPTAPTRATARTPATVADPPPEQPDAATSMATRTAARKTAAAAGPRSRDSKIKTV
jgi:chromosome segregation ATPase